MIGILISLIMVWIKLNMERWDAPFKVIRWIWWPFAFLTGWIAVALIANVASYLNSIGWTGGLSEELWTVIMLVVATGVNLFMLVTRSSREFVSVGVWAITAIAVRHWGEIAIIQWTAVICVLILTAGLVMHAAKHWDTNPYTKWRRSIQ